MISIGIIGNGFVGKATKQLACNNNLLITYDINPNLCSPDGATIDNICACDIIFISVPTPMNKDNSCCLDIIDDVIYKLKQTINF